MSIFISTGELSGDIYAAKLSAALHKILPGEKLWGMGGALADGVCKEWDNASLHIIGLGRIIKSLPSLFRLRKDLARAVVERVPRAVIVVDSPDFHIPLLSKIRSLGYKGPVIYVCPPTIWAWRRGRVKKLKRYCDLCLPLFHFEKEALQAWNVRSYWCGNPLIDDLGNFVPVGASVPYDAMRVALLPGSRRSEIRALMPILQETALKLKSMGLHPVFSIAPGLDEPSKAMVRNNEAGIESTEISGRNLMYASNFVIGASGTTAVEAMLLNRYMIVLYKGTLLEWQIYKMLTHTPFVSIPNVLAEKMMFPELLQDDARADKILRYAALYLHDADYRDGIHKQIASNRRLMGEPGAIRRWAEVISGLVNS